MPKVNSDATPNVHVYRDNADKITLPRNAATNPKTAPSSMPITGENAHPKLNTTLSPIAGVNGIVRITASNAANTDTNATERDLIFKLFLLYAYFKQRILMHSYCPSSLVVQHTR
jgi:hypothetical protein